MVNKRAIRDEVVIIEMIIVIGVKEVVANIIKEGIIASAKNSFKQAIKDQMILWWHLTIKKWLTWLL